MYYFRGSLPWQGIHHDDQKKKFDMILQKKASCGKKELVGGIKAAEKFWQFYDYLNHLEFEEEPDYDKLKRILDEIKDEYCVPLTN